MDEWTFFLFVEGRILDEGGLVVGGANVIIRTGFAIDAVAQTAVRCVRGSLPRVSDTGN